jgi:PAS domain S-box-containing protein
VAGALSVDAVIEPCKRGDFHPKDTNRDGLGIPAKTTQSLPVRLGAETHAHMKFSTTTAFRGATAGVDMQLLEQLFDHTPDTAFFIKDAAGRYLAVNRSLLERHGLRDRSQMLGRRPSDVCPGDFGRIPAEQDAYVLRTGRPIVEHLELQWYSPHKPVWCLTTKLPMRDPTGAITGLIGISKDVRSPVAPEEIPASVAAALARLESSYAESLTPMELARIAKLPPARFARIIKRIFGITPVQLISKTRIAAASSLLRETERSIAEIAHECGFYDHSAFTRAFRAVVGVTPTQFRAG